MRFLVGTGTGPKEMSLGAGAKVGPFESLPHSAQAE